MRMKVASKIFLLQKFQIFKINKQNSFEIKAIYQIGW